MSLLAAMRGAAAIALGEALAWLTVNILIMPTPGANGQNGHHVITRRGRQALDRQSYDRYRNAASFPKVLLHPMIAEDVWLNLARGDYATAVFQAFRTVEEAVRKVGGFRPDDFGIDLMRKAFNPTNGPLAVRNTATPTGEIDALANLFAGAIGVTGSNPDPSKFPVDFPTSIRCATQGRMVLASLMPSAASC